MITVLFISIALALLAIAWCVWRIVQLLFWKGGGAKSRSSSDWFNGDFDD